MSNPLRRIKIVPPLAVALVLALGFALLNPLATAGHSGTFEGYGLFPNQGIVPGDYLTSPDGHFVLVMKTNGDAALQTNGGHTVWTTKTAGRPSTQLDMLSTGSLAVLSIPTKRVWWSTKTAGYPGAWFEVENDGNMVLYYQDPGNQIWQSRTNTSVAYPKDTLTPGQYLVSSDLKTRLTMQHDGNLVLACSGAAMWSSGTHGHAGAVMTMRPSGNLTVGLPGKAPLWTSNTSRYPGSFLVIQPDGNLVVYYGPTPEWASKTSGKCN